MFSRRKAAKRFNLLLLEDEEYYVADWVASCRWPSSITGNWQGLQNLPGRLRLCTRSLFFEPDDVRVPIVRLEFGSVVQLEADSMQSCIVGANKVTKMKANMADEPYTVERGKSSTWLFTLTYAKLDSFMPLAQEQLVISRLPAADRLSLLDASVKAREDAVIFDTSRLVEFSERLLWEGPVLQLSPLVREPGRLAVTDQRVYFQPLHNVSGDTLVRSHPLAAVAAVARRRSSLRPIGLELFMISPSLEAQLQQHIGQLSGPFWDAPSAFFTFRSQEDRNKALTALTSQPQLGTAVSRLTPHSPDTTPTHSSTGTTQHAAQQQLAAAGALLEANSTWLQRVMMAWQLGKIKNFDYLLYLNLAAGRSFNDLAQWPVFPWVLRDYSSAVLDLTCEQSFRDLSKPMGALTPSRLEVFRQRFHDMESISQHVDAAGDMPKPFMYGTHYSTPGYVMYWLVRAAPGHMLRLQGGKFDAPDRLFNSLKDSWDSATTSTTDVKELIPEFFMPGGDFLVNGSQLAFGVRQNGRPVNDVILPPWASGPEDLLAKHRAALEAPYVSAHLHEWIDLIFGYKQTGPAAVEADNVFYHLTYEGAVDISKVTNLNELRALETQINEFGQTPKQLFTHPHPPRLVQPPAPDPATVFSHTAGAVMSSANRSSSNSPIPPIPGGLGIDSPVLPSPSGKAGSSGSKARLKSGTEDAAGGAICFALLSTILAAAAPEVEAAAADSNSMHAADAAGNGTSERGLQLSPVSSGDLLSAAPCSTSPFTEAGKPGLQQEIPAGSAAAHAAAEARGSLPAAAGGTGQQQQVGALRGMLNRLTEGAAAAAGSAAASMASAVQASGTASSSIPGLPSLPVLGGSKRLSLSWMQQQFAEGLSLRNNSGSSAESSSLRAAPDSSAVQPGTVDGTGSKAPTTTGSRDYSGSDRPAAAAAGSRGDKVMNGGAAGNKSSPASSSIINSGERHWPRNLPDGLLVKKSLRLQSEPLTAVAPSLDGSFLVVAGHNGLLRVLSARQLSTHRSIKLDNADLMCLSLLSTNTGAAGGGVVGSHGSGTISTRADIPSSSATVPLPFVLAGAQSGRVLGYAAAAGRMVGSWAAHDDAVSSMLQLGGHGGVGAGMAASSSGTRLVTASWDCSVKVWEVAEGRQPWSSTLPLPQLELRDLESGVWALSASASGQLLVTGTEEGMVAAWDLRTRQQIWSTQVSSDYVGGLSLLPGGNYVAAAAADGTLSLLEWRRAGERIASSSCGSPLRCCTCDGQLMISGTEAGQLLMWNLGQLTGHMDQAAGGFSLAGPDGLYPPLSCPSKAPVNCVAVAVAAREGGGEQGSGAEHQTHVVGGLDDGTLVMFSNQ